jgi:hypothetical protein
MPKHSGKFKWKKYSKHKGNLIGYWTAKNRTTDRHRKEDDERGSDNGCDSQVSP